MNKEIPYSPTKPVNPIKKLKTLEQEVNRLKIKLNKGNNIIDYFLVLGVEPSICKENFLYSSTIKELNNKYKSSLSPKILSKFPPFIKSFVDINDGIIQHCFPKGFEVKQYQRPPKPEFFSFILDNYQFSLKYPQKYVSCLIFYESIADYEKLQNLIEKKNEGNNKVNKFKKRKQRSKSSGLNELFALKINEPPSTTRRDSVGKRIMITFHSYYLPKCICAISICPLYDSHYIILKAIYNNSFNLNSDIPIEKIIQNIAIETPLPPKGLYKVGINIFDEYLLVHQRRINEIPNVEKEISIILSYLGIENTIEIFKHMLFETKIIFFSLNQKILRPIIYGFLSMIFPFKYLHQVISFIPFEKYNIIESISPYIVGVNDQYEEDFFSKNNIDISEVSILIVDLNRKTVKLHSKEQFPHMPISLKKKLSVNINNALKKMKRMSIKENNSDEHTLHLPFFKCIISIMKTYPLFLNHAYFTSHDKNQTNNIKTLFKVQDFLSSFSNSERPFYSKLVNDTQIFSDIIFKRMIPNDVNDKLEILLFDENIILKGEGKKVFGKQEPIFITSKEYDHTTIVQPTIIVPLTQQEIKKFNRQYIFSQLSNAQVIKERKGKLFFNYPLFPTLNMDIFFNGIKNIVPLRKLNIEIDSINNELVSKSHLESISLNKTEMENCIYLSWLLAWGGTFWYHEEKEKIIFFNLMINILDKVTHHEMEIINFLFQVLVIYNNEEMILKLYKKILFLKLNPSQYIYKIVSKILDREKIKINIDNQDDLECLIKSPGKNGKIKKRTFKNKYDDNIIGEEIKFNTFDKCLNCNKNIDIKKVSMDYEKMRKEPLWAICPLCCKNTFVKLSVRMGIDLNKSKCIGKKTSFVDSVALFSPYLLKLGLTDAVWIETGKIIDVSTFKSNFIALFWNAIWYFKLKGLDYRMILPYADNQKQKKKKEFFICNIGPCPYFNQLKTILKQSQKEKTKPTKWEICRLDIQNICSIELSHKNKKLVSHIEEKN